MLDSVASELPGLFIFIPELLEKLILGQMQPSLLLGSIPTGPKRQAEIGLDAARTPPPPFHSG